MKTLRDCAKKIERETDRRWDDEEIVTNEGEEDSRQQQLNKRFVFINWTEQVNEQDDRYVDESKSDFVFREMDVTHSTLDCYLFRTNVLPLDNRMHRDRLIYSTAISFLTTIQDDIATLLDFCSLHKLKMRKMINRCVEQ